ncbi:MAG: hypothetical protein LBT88_04105 [Oscillospiraceae bacterium]|jgi:hypothetical protein|nr:hypothetical protein [Oscillospiraceae bacterium]
MLKNKRILSVLLALSMVVTLLAGFGATASAVTDDVTATVTLYVEYVAREDDGTIAVQYNLIDNPIVYIANVGDTLKDVINQISIAGVKFDNAEWYDNDGVPDTSWLSSLDVNTDYDDLGWVNYPDWNDYEDVGGGTYYYGESWLYFFGTPNYIPATIDDYPATLIGDYVITGAVTITLSYEFNAFIF